MASSWILFFIYQDDARSNTYKISKSCLHSIAALYLPRPLSGIPKAEYRVLDPGVDKKKYYR